MIEEPVEKPFIEIRKVTWQFYKLSRKPTNNEVINLMRMFLLQTEFGISPEIASQTHIDDMRKFIAKGLLEHVRDEEIELPKGD